MFYKNTSFATKTFYGVSFKPGEIHDVPGYINDPMMIRTKAVPMPKEPPKAKQTVEPKPAKLSKPEVENKNKEENSDGTDNN